MGIRFSSFLLTLIVGLAKIKRLNEDYRTNNVEINPLAAGTLDRNARAETSLEV